MCISKSKSVDMGEGYRATPFVKDGRIGPVLKLLGKHGLIVSDLRRSVEWPKLGLRAMRFAPDNP